MKKFLACDVDGTLIRIEEDLGSEACAAVREFRKRGHFFALCTGRTINWVRPLFEAHPLEADALILANGASLYLVEQFRPFAAKKMSVNAIPAAVGLEMISYLYHDENIMLYWGDGERTYELVDRPLEVAATFHSVSADTVFLTYQDFCNSPMDIIGFGTAPLSRDIKEAHRIAQTISERWGHAVDVVHNMFFVDVMVKSVSKGEGIRRMRELLGEPYRCYGVGDSFNDEPMFRYLGKEHSFLMNTGDEELSPLVREKVPSVARCIEILLNMP